MIYTYLSNGVTNVFVLPSFSFLHLVFPSYIHHPKPTIMFLRLFSLCIACLFCLHALAQKQKTSATVTTPSVNYDEVFKTLKWRNIGPFRGGRANAISGVKGNDKLY